MQSSLFSKNTPKHYTFKKRKRYVYKKSVFILVFLKIFN